MIQLTPGQWVAIVVGVLSATAGASAQLTPVFGATLAHAIVSTANLVMTVFITPVLFVMTGQSQLVKSVQAMPGVTKIEVNAQANQTLAALAVDEANKKIEASPSAAEAVERTAKGA